MVYYWLIAFFGLKNFKKPHENKTNPEQIHAEFKGDLRENQKEIIKSFLPKFYSDTGGILNVKTGGGKTCMACYIISKLKVKTLILVHKQFLADQWVSRINQFLPNVKISKIQGKTVDSSGDIVLGMIQSISSKNFDADFCTPEKKRNIVFRNEGGGGGQRPFGSFPKIHPKWSTQSSLTSQMRFSFESSRKISCAILSA